MKQLPLLPKSPLKPLSKDKRDKPFVLGRVFQLPKLSEIPNTDWSFDKPLEIKNQGNTQMCTAFAAAAVVEDHEGVILDPGYSYAKENQIRGTKGDVAGDLRDVAEAMRQFGALEKAKSPFPDRDVSFTSDPANWPLIYDDYASAHKQSSYFWVHDGPYDIFDNIRTALWMFRADKNSILAGSYWYPAWSFPAVIPKEPQTTQPSGHAFKGRITQKMINGEPYLAIQQSYGTGAGDNGTQYFPRVVVNREWKDFGALMFTDMTPEDIRQRKIGILQQLIYWWTQLLYRLHPETAPTPAPVEPEPQLTPHVSRIEDWAKAIQTQEGGKPGDLNIVLNNPGNLKYAPLIASWGATKGKPASDGGWIAQFSTYDKGFQALCEFLTLGCKDQLKAFHQSRTLKLFTQTYANPPANHPYAATVAAKLGVDVNVDIKELL